jgi:hypothetical protein
MKNVLLILTTITALTLSMAAGAECIYPKMATEIPDGSKATQPEIVAAMTAVKKYNEDINAYLSCLEVESESQIAALADPKPEQIKQIKGIQTAKHNAAVDELEKQATRFNVQLKAYKAKNPG